MQQAYVPFIQNWSNTGLSTVPAIAGIKIWDIIETYYDSYVEDRKIKELKFALIIESNDLQDAKFVVLSNTLCNKDITITKIAGSEDGNLYLEVANVQGNFISNNIHTSNNNIKGWAVSCTQPVTGRAEAMTETIPYNPSTRSFSTGLFCTDATNTNTGTIDFSTNAPILIYTIQYLDINY